MVKMELLTKANICNRKFMHELYMKYAVDTGEPYHNAFPVDLAIQLFGNDAYDWLYELSQGLCTSYQTVFNDVRYLDVSGFYAMRDFRAVMCYREMIAKWHEENEVLKHDTSTGKKHGKQCVSDKAKQV